VQLLDIDAAENDLVRGERVDVFHRRFDQIVEVEVFDVERFAHMGAAGPQQLAHSGLVVNFIKFCPQLRWRRRNLAEHQRGRKYFCEQHVHSKAPAKWRAMRKAEDAPFVPDDA